MPPKRRDEEPRDHAVMAAWPQPSWGFRVPESLESEIIKSIFDVLYLAAQSRGELGQI
jgi:hypothetical protein